MAQPRTRMTGTQRRAQLIGVARGLFAERAISREGFVSVGGTVARARLVPAGAWEGRGLEFRS